MVSDMPGSDVGTGSDRKGIIAGDTAAHPSFFRQISEEAQGSQANFAKFFDMAGPREIVCPRVLDCRLLIKAWQRAAKTAGEPYRSKYEDALGVVHMVPRLAYAPLSGRIAMKRFFLGDSLQK